MASEYGQYVQLEELTGTAPAHLTDSVMLYASGAASEASTTQLYMKDSAGAEYVIGGSWNLEDGDGTELAITGGAQLKFVEGGAIDINWSDTSHGIDGDEYDMTFTLNINGLSATTTVDDADLVVIDDGAGGTLRKMTRAHFIESAALDAINIDGGAIDGTAIGANSAAAGTFTAIIGTSAVVNGNTALSGTLHATGNTQLQGTLEAKGAASFEGAVTAQSTLVAGNTAVSGTLHATGNTQLQGTLEAVGAASFEAAITAQNNLTVAGVTALNGNVDLGDATGDTVTVTGRFDSDLVPSTDSARDLGTSALQWAEAHVDHGHIDTITATGTSTLTTVDINGGNIDGTAIGAASAAAGTFAAIIGTSAVINGNAAVSGTLHATGNSQLQGTLEVVGASNFEGAADMESTLNVDGNFTANATVTLGNAASDVTTVTGKLSGSNGIKITGNSDFDDVLVRGDLEVMGAVNTITNHETELHIADKVILIASGTSKNDGAAALGALDQGGLYLGSTGSLAVASIVWDAGNDRWHTPESMHVSGAMLVGGASTFSGNQAVTGTLHTTGNSQFQGTLEVVGASSFEGAVTAQSTLVAGNTAVTGTLHATGNTQLQGTLEAVGAASFEAAITAQNNLTVSGVTALNGNVDLGDATGDTITATARFDSDLVPSTDSARDLGTSALQWAEAHVDHGYIDAITATGTSTLTTVDINGGAIDGTAIGAASAAAGTFAAIIGTSAVVNGNAAVSGTLHATGNSQLQGTLEVVGASSFEGAVTAQGTVTVGTRLVPDSAGGADLGSTSAEWGDLYIADDKKIKFGSGQDATIEYDEDGTDELRFAGAAVTFEQAVTFDGNVTLGDAAGDVTTVTGKLSGSNGALISGDFVTIGTTGLSGSVAFAGGYTANGDYGMSFNSANGNLTARGAVGADGGATFGGGYGSTGVSISSAGVIQMNSNLTCDGGATFGGGYGSTGVSISSAGAVSANGALTVANTVSGAAGQFTSIDIGGSNQSGYALAIPNNTDNSGKAIAHAWRTYSSERFKTNIKTIETPIATLSKLRGVTYDWKGNGAKDVGFIAEEVGKIIPEVVDFEENGTDATSMDYSRLTAILVEAVKEQQATISSLKSAVAKLASQHDEIDG